MANDEQKIKQNIVPSYSNLAAENLLALKLA